MSKGPVESKIPVLSNRKPIAARISRPFATLSTRVLAHLSPVDTATATNKLGPGSPSSTFLGILNSGGSKSRSNSIEDELNHSRIKATDIGKRVTLSVSCEKIGTLEFVGGTQFGCGVWCGVELDTPNGVNDGAVGNTRYFTCRPNHGVFVPLEKVHLLEGARIENETLDSCAHFIAQKSNLKLNFELSSVDAACSEASTPAKISKHNSLDLDESLGILSPDQMADFAMTDEIFHRTISCELMPSLVSELKSNLSGSSLKVSESTPVEDVTMNGIMELDDCLSSKSEYLHLQETSSSSSYVEQEKNIQNCLIERSPSLEDLPMDEIVTQGELANPSSHAQLIPNPTSFITSVTSIASLDNGYQGDGELSRPTSRGADHSPTAHQNVKKVIDSMTDSDFFTESDADVHDDLGRGDRRAQVIDGIIYGGLLNQQSPRRKSGTYSQITEEMESSGVYSDVDRTLLPLAETMDSCEIQPIVLSEDTSPSEASTKDETAASTETLQNASSPDLKKNDTKVVKKSKTEASNKKFKMPNRNVTSKVKSMISGPPVRKNPEEEGLESRKCRPNKKGKWDAVMDKIAQGQSEKKTQPRLKEVKSKVFSQMSESTSNKRQTPISHSTSTRSLRDTSEQKPKKRTRVRSSDLSTQSAGGAGVGNAHPSQNSSLNSSVTDLSEQNSASLHSTKISSSSSSSSAYTRSLAKQHGRGDVRVSSPVSDEGKLTLPRLKENVTSRSTNSIASIQSKSANGNGKTNVCRKQLSRPVRDHSRLSSAPPQRIKTDANQNVQTRVRPTSAKAETKTSSSASSPPQVDLAPQLKHAVTTVDALGVLVQYLSVHLDAFSTPLLKSELDKMRRDWLQSKEDLAHAETAYKQLQAEFTSRTVHHQTEIEKLKRCHEERELRIQETHEADLNKLRRTHEEDKSSLEQHFHVKCESVVSQGKEEMLRLEKKHMEEYETLKNKLTSAEKEAESKMYTLTEEYAKTVADLKQSISQLQSEKETLTLQYNTLTHSETNSEVPASKLTHEVESLHHVLDLRNKDISELRIQNAFLAQDVEDLPNVRTKLVAANTRIEDLTIQLTRKIDVEQELLAENRSLKEYYRIESAKVQTLQRQNEELQWALKQKSEALNVLAHSTPKKVPSTCNHGKKSSELSDVKQSFEQSPPSSPKVLSVLEKNDSVSWVVELEEAPDIVSKYLRRTNSFRSIGGGGPSPKRPSKSPKQQPSGGPTPPAQERVRSVSVPIDHSADSSVDNLWVSELSRSADADTFDVHVEPPNEHKSNFSLDLQSSSGDFLVFSEEGDKASDVEEELLGVVVPKDSAGEAMISSEEDSSSCSQSEDETRSSSSSSMSVDHVEPEDDIVFSSESLNNNVASVEETPKCDTAVSVEEAPKCDGTIRSVQTTMIPPSSKCNDEKLIQNFSQGFHASKQMEHEP